MQEGKKNGALSSLSLSSRKLETRQENLECEVSRCHIVLGHSGQLCEMLSQKIEKSRNL